MINLDSIENYVPQVTHTIRESQLPDDLRRRVNLATKNADRDDMLHYTGDDGDDDPGNWVFIVRFELIDENWYNPDQWMEDLIALLPMEIVNNNKLGIWIEQF